METQRRTLVKAVIWNVMGLTVMALVGLIMIGPVMVGGAMAIVNTIIGLCCYFAYERVWAKISWGRIHG